MRSQISTRHKRRDTDQELSRRIIHEVPYLVTDLVQHPSPYILSLESKWLAQELAEYRTLPKKDIKKRLNWIERKFYRRDSKRAYGLLGGLVRVTRCPRTDCKRQTKMPTHDDLEAWTYRAGSGVKELSFHILAYYHGSTYQTVKRLLRSRSLR